MSLGESLPVLGNFFQLTYVENSGIAFGLFNNHAGGSLIVTVVAMGATVAVAWYLWRVRHGELALKLSLAFVFGGAIGNLIDRLLFGRVADFFDFSIGGYHWPVFNVADSSVTVGMILFLYVSFIGVSHLEEESV